MNVSWFCWTFFIIVGTICSETRDKIEYYRFFRINDTSEFTVQYFDYDLYTGENAQYAYRIAAVCADSAMKLNYYDCLICGKNLLYQNIIEESRPEALMDGIFPHDLTNRFLLEVYDGLLHHQMLEMNHNIHVCIMGQLSTQLLITLSKLLGSSLPTREIKLSFYTMVDQMKTSIVESMNRFYQQIVTLRTLYSHLKIQTFIYSTWNELFPSQLESVRECSIFHFREESIFHLWQTHYISHLISSNLSASIPIIYEQSRFHWNSFEEYFSQRVVDNITTHARHIEWDGVGRGYHGKVENTHLLYSGINCGVVQFSWYEVIVDQPFEIYFGRVITQESPFPLSSSSVFSSVSSTGDTTSIKQFNWRQDVQFFITFDVNFYIETAYGLQKVLTDRLGCAQVEVMGRFNYSLYLAYVQNSNHADRAVIQIALGPHRPTILTKDYIVFHTENTWDSFVKSDQYSVTLLNARGILAYSQSNVNFFRELFQEQTEVLSVAKPVTLPIGIIPIYSIPIYFEVRVHDTTSKEQRLGYYEKIYHKDSANEDLTVSPQIGQNYRTVPLGDDFPIYDLIFLGSSSHGRRAKFISQVVNDSIADGITFIASGLVSTIDFFDVYTREFYLVYSKVVINLHQFEDSILETHRINHLLSLGKCVISERSLLDPFLDSHYEDAIVFVDSIEALYPTALQYIRNADLRRVQERKAFRKYQEMMRDTTSLAEVLESIYIVQQQT